MVYERLNALVTPSNPLTADDIFATSLLISVPASWLHSISHLLNSPKTSSAEIVSCLKAESNRRASSIDGFPSSVSAARTFTNRSSKFKDPSRDGKPPRSQYDADLYCSFCKITGHDLKVCKTAARVLADHTQQAVDDLKRGQGSRSSKSSRPARAAKTHTVPLGGSSDDAADPVEDEESSDDDPRLSYPRAQARTAVVAAVSRASGPGDWTIDSACSRTMRPSTHGLASLWSDRTPVNLADNYVISASHTGMSQLPLTNSVSISTLVVPDLHEPLLSVAGVCDKGLSVVFRSSGCQIY